MKLRDKIFSGHLDEGEKILYIAHRHVLVFKLKSFKVFNLGILAPTILFLFFPQALVVFLVWWTIGVGGVLYHFIDWYFDAWLITNIGVIDVERNGLFERTSTRIEYYMIEGIAYTIKGFTQTVFNYGDITIDKMGAATQVVLRDAASPKKIERLIMKYQEQYVADKSIRDHSALKNMLSEMIAYHVQNDKVKNPYKH
ncbi:MAG: PH domain-containing protein [Candidatus Gracilibacteria bacterium]